MILVSEGRGTFKADLSEDTFETNSLICFSIYQPFMIRAESGFTGILINFHPDFFCIHKHQHEVACNGVLFNNIYDSPLVRLDEREMTSLSSIINELKAEMQKQALAQYELMISWLKIFLINASRIKLEQHPVREYKTEKEPFNLKTLKDAVEEIAYDLGFNDEFCFSRFFKNNADISPQTYRQTVGFAKGEV